MGSSGVFGNNNLLIRTSIDGTIVIGHGGREISSTSGSWGTPLDFAAKTGKWYIEYYVNSGSSGRNVMVVPTNSDKYQQSNYNFGGTGDYNIILNSSGGIYNNNDSTATQTVGSSLATGDVMGVAMDLDSSPRTVQFYRNGTTTGTAENINASATGHFTFMNMGHNQSTMTVNSGQDGDFVGEKGGSANASDDNGFGSFYYSPPSGFLAMCSANLPIDEDVDPATTSSDFSIKNHNTIVYTGTGSARDVTGLGFKPDLVWIQNYSSQNQTPRLMDSSRGVGKDLRPSYSDAESSESDGLTAFGTDGFSIGTRTGGYNTSTAKYVAWCWRANGGTTSTNTSGTITSEVQANTAGGFSIITYTGTGTNGTIGHGLTAAPEYMIIKNIDTTDNWVNYNKVGGAANRGQINTGNYGTSTTSFQSTDPSATVITLGTSHGVNKSTSDYVAYVWHGVEGYSKFDKYKGNGNSDGPFVYTGFRPRLLSLIRSTGGIYDVYDSGRYEFNTVDAYMQWSTDSAETTGYPIDFLSNGFKIRTNGTGINQSGTIFYYAAWGDSPLKYGNAK